MINRFMNKGNVFPSLIWFDYNYEANLSWEDNQSTPPSCESSRDIPGLGSS